MDALGDVMRFNRVEGELLTTSIVREFAGLERRFELRLGEIRKLEAATGHGIGEVYRRLATLSFGYADVRETIKLALVGGSDGNTSEVEAEGLMRAFADGWPINDTHALAMDIARAAFVGCDQAGGFRGSRSGSPATSAPSTSPERPEGSARATSTG